MLSIVSRLPAASILAVLPAPLVLAAGRVSPLWSLIGAALMLAGLAVLRPGRRGSAMLLLCSAGMLLGLFVDCRFGQAGLALCTGSGRGHTLIQDWARFPAMQLGMVLGGLAATGLDHARLGVRLACCLVMSAGMAAAGTAGMVLAAAFDDGALSWIMLALMPGGMVLGAACFEALERAMSPLVSFDPVPIHKDGKSGRGGNHVQGRSVSG